MKTIDERFDEKWEPVPWSGCFVWTGYANDSGHGRFKINGKLDYAYRYSYWREYGDIPNGLFVCHHCDNPFCINPAHLFLGTQLDNMRDCKSKNRSAREFRLPQTKLTDEQAVLIAADPRTQVEIALIYGVSQQLVSNIKLGNRRADAVAGRTINWRHGQKLTPDDVAAILLDSRPQKIVAKQYGVDQSRISQIKSQHSLR